ncbi:conserved hypothetical protein [Deferribacter desulfuricans SSM1]|uniref:Uncharacterized protein n=1 Tax=Deferribacter desulfuricans (strain DSM 14783 / JCM 11476 / NBRC 101012 / SSM1) TaxID=639282 RepID=D3PE31_DEFDS|nr:hypothetical protein [Deferribacter desulfuricans]BAI80854.1 conserved hypothetical protein [Deferribacter desulfuricans SSM1]
MFKKLILIIFLFLSSYLLYAGDVSDYLLGVSAFKDQLYDVAKISLEDFLKDAKDEKKINFAKYLLYQIYLSEDNYDKALELINELENVNDKKIDTKLLRYDKVKILAEKDCDLAKSYLIENFYDYTLKAYLSSNCKVDKDISKKSLRLKLDNKLRLALAIKLKDFPEEASKQFDKIDIRKLDNKNKKSFAILFYKNGNYDKFWKIYRYYKDSDMVNLALDRVWDIKKYDSFLKSFEINRKKYKISNINYCRAYKIQKENGLKVDCDLLDNCFVKHDEKYYESYLNCSLAIKDIDKFKKRYLLWSKKSDKIKCMYAYDGYKLNLLRISDFKNCKNRYDIADKLLADEKAKEVLLLLSEDSSDQGLYFKVLAYLLLNDTASAEKAMKKIKDKEILNKLNEFMK